MHPFTPEELGSGFSLDDALTHGLLPIVWDSDDRDETLAAYARMYLKEEIQAESLVRNLPGFARFLPLAALFHGQALNVANIAREAGVARTTVCGHLEILEETLLCFRVAGYEAKIRVRERTHPKWYWCDPGIVRAMKRTSGLLVPEERGALFEGLVAQLIRTYRDYAKLCDDFNYWSPPGGGGMEVDFVLRRGDELLAIEVKSGKSFEERWCRGLRALGEIGKVRRRIVVYPEGPVLRTKDKIDILPFVTFSGLVAAGEIWP
jgi:predicted AAA+ superfamily ATPase